MNEASLKRELVKAIPLVMPGAVVLRHEDKFLSGVPDLSVSWNKNTLWCEVKYAKPRLDLRGRGRQTLEAQRLAVHGKCTYVIYDQMLPSGVWIVSPSSIRGNDGGTWRSAPTSLRAVGYDHGWVAQKMRSMLCQ